jgi:hypothetical protein
MIKTMLEMPDGHIARAHAPITIENAAQFAFKVVSVFSACTPIDRARIALHLQRLPRLQVTKGRLIRKRLLPVLLASLCIPVHAELYDVLAIHTAGHVMMYSGRLKFFNVNGVDGGLEFLVQDRFEVDETRIEKANATTIYGHWSLIFDGKEEGNSRACYVSASIMAYGLQVVDLYCKTP